MPAAPPALVRPEPIPMDQRETWSVHETSRMVGVSRRTIQGAIYGGHLKAVRCGRRVLLRPADVRAWLDSLVK
jgi:excisionase family DNA binding protein